MLQTITTKDSLDSWRTKVNKTIQVVNTLSSTTNGGTANPGTGAVDSVAGRTGAVTLFADDINGLGSAAKMSSGSFATAAQGAKADSALQLSTADSRYARSVNGVLPDSSGDISILTTSLPETFDCGNF